jgi:hypothetical protein
MKKILVLLLIICCSGLYAESVLAFAENGKTVLLHEDGTWVEKQRSQTSDTESVPSEPILFKYATTQNDDVLYEQYMQYYGGKDPKNSQIILYHQLFANTYKTSEETNLKYLSAISYVYEYGKIFQIPATYGASVSLVSNLFFFWNYAQILEDEKKYSEAVDYLTQLKTLFINSESKYKFNIFHENTTETIDMYIYTLKLKISNNKQ